MRGTIVNRTNYNRQALRYVIRNTTLPARMRAEAQLKLHQMHCYTRPTQIVNRCIMGGKGKGVFRDVRMARVSSDLILPNLVGVMLRGVDGA
jgi:small subunit ribosomal protein S14